jgi:hypothetical protein
MGRKQARMRGTFFGLLPSARLRSVRVVAAGARVYNRKDYSVGLSSYC